MMVQGACIFEDDMNYSEGLQLQRDKLIRAKNGGEKKQLTSELTVDSNYFAD